MSDIPRHFLIALSQAERAFRAGDYAALATINMNLQPLVDAAMARVNEAKAEADTMRAWAERAAATENANAADLLRATRERDRLRAVLAEIIPCIPTPSARDVLRHIAAIRLGTGDELDHRDAWADAEHDWRKEGYTVPAEALPGVLLARAAAALRGES